jgi:hypothetical protein
VVNFGAALTISAIMSAPWPSFVGASFALAVCGLCGVGYSAIAVRRARRQTHYTPVSEDWFWYAIIPASIYAALTLAALMVRTTTEVSLFVIAAAALGLLLIGIRNAWDMVTYIVVASDQSDASKSE